VRNSHREQHGAVVTDPQIDPELLAAVLDGTATASERDVVLAIAVRSHAAYAQFAEAAALHRELQPTEMQLPEMQVTDHADAHPQTLVLMPAAPVPASSAVRRRGRMMAVRLGAVAAAAAVALVVVRRSGNTPVDSPERFAVLPALTGVAGNGSLERRLGEHWAEPGWTVVRGSGDVAADAAAAYRAGVRMTELDISVTVHDSVAVAAAAREIRALLANASGSAPLALRLEAIERLGRVGADVRLPDLRAQLAAVLGHEDWFSLGRWTEAARLAVLSREPNFLVESGRPRAELRRLISRTPVPVEKWTEVRTQMSLLDSDTAGASDFAAQAAAIQELMRLAGG
jgi:hypothetical protein